MDGWMDVKREVSGDYRQLKGMYSTSCRIVTCLCLLLGWAKYCGPGNRRPGIMVAIRTVFIHD